MAEEARLRAVTIATLAVILAGLGIVEALDQFGASPLLPALFPVLPLGAALFLALRQRSLSFVDIARGGHFGSRALAFASAGVALSAVMLIAAPVATALGGWRGLVPILAFVVGLLGATLVVMPSLRTEGASSLADAIGRRFGRAARAVAAIAILSILLPLLAAEISLAGMVGARMLGVPVAVGREIMVGLALIAGLLGGLGAGIAVAAVLLPVVILAFIAPVGIVSLGESALPMPWIGLFDRETLSSVAQISPVVLVTLSVSLVIGVATMPALMFPAWNLRRRPLRRLDFTVSSVIVGVVLLAAPSYAVYGKIAGIDASGDPAGLVLGFPDHVGLSATPSVLLIGGLLTAALASAIMNLVTAATAIGNDLYGPFVERRTPDNRRVFIARLAMIVIAIGLLAFLRRPASGSVATLAGIGLSMSAATLGPVLLFGGLIRHHRGLAATGAMIVGLWLTAADIVLARYYPQFGPVFGMATVSDTVLGPTGWFGLPIGLSGIIGFVYGSIALFALSVLPRLPWRMGWIRLLIAARHLRRRLERLTLKKAPVVEPNPLLPVIIEAAPSLGDVVPLPILAALPSPRQLEALPPPREVLAITLQVIDEPVPAREADLRILSLPAPEPEPEPEPEVLLVPVQQATPQMATSSGPRPKWRYRRRPTPFTRMTPPRRRKGWRVRRF